MVKHIRQKMDNELGKMMKQQNIKKEYEKCITGCMNINILKMIQDIKKKEKIDNQINDNKSIFSNTQTQINKVEGNFDHDDQEFIDNMTSIGDAKIDLIDLELINR